MPDIELTSAEPQMTDELTLAEREWADAQTDATIIIWALKHADRLISLARASLEAGKAEESMREKAAKAAEARGEQYVEPTQASYDMRQGCYDAATAIRALPLTGGGE